MKVFILLPPLRVFQSIMEYSTTRGRKQSRIWKTAENASLKPETTITITRVFTALAQTDCTQSRIPFYYKFNPQTVLEIASFTFMTVLNRTLLKQPNETSHLVNLTVPNPPCLNYYIFFKRYLISQLLYVGVVSWYRLFLLEIMIFVVYFEIDQKKFKKQHLPLNADWRHSQFVFFSYFSYWYQFLPLFIF